MKYGIIADIHSNLEALNAVREALSGENIDKLICPGDIVGYNADPVACVDFIKENKVISIKGNHDRLASGEDSGFSFNEIARHAALWSRERLDSTRKSFLESLPDEKIIDESILIVHGSPRDRDEYIFSLTEAQENVKHIEAKYPGLDIIFFSHTHIPAFFTKEKAETSFKETRTIKLDKKEIFFINPGSIGQPRDECPYASFAIFDSEKMELKIMRVKYNIEATQRKIIQAGLSQKLAMRLAFGI
ncbi:metallophosphoesterase [candidate division NPL-UPA2 bacterium Unc8]|uniref:Metallophosphoesterase n=1 Tax=candidate division NPL-UPA2 bacterium Unc8 TaxID=1980939 RepID=A0A399FWS5_UNCN2|nr:hypothetical protein [Bacillota bacterium]MBT9138060.1 hypothetical protein [Bacillota bacterium]RIH99869.1 MAG: metallophosphoesterase [candidate division NPL-UPA2 bacterium Unc8]